LDGYDEISLTGGVKIISNGSEEILYPEDFKLNKLKSKSIIGGRSIKESAEIFMSVLSNQSTESQKKVVVANSALAISTSTGVSIEEGISRAKESLNSKNALKAFNTLKKLSE